MGRSWSQHFYTELPQFHASLRQPPPGSLLGGVFPDPPPILSYQDLWYPRFMWEAKETQRG